MLPSRTSENVQTIQLISNDCLTFEIPTYNLHTKVRKSKSTISKNNWEIFNFINCPRQQKANFPHFFLTCRGTYSLECFKANIWRPLQLCILCIDRVSFSFRKENEDREDVIALRRSFMKQFPESARSWKSHTREYTLRYPTGCFWKKNHSLSSICKRTSCLLLLRLTKLHN